MRLGRSGHTPRPPLALSELSEVLWAAGGRRSDGADAASGATRTYPSAGSIYPVQIYVIVGAVTGAKPGISQYRPADHAMKVLKQGDHREELVRGPSEAGFDLNSSRPTALFQQAIDFSTVLIAPEKAVWTLTAVGLVLGSF